MKTANNFILMIILAILLTSCSSPKNNKTKETTLTSESEHNVTNYLESHAPESSPPDTAPPETTNMIEMSDKNFYALTRLVFEGRYYSLKELLRAKFTFDKTEKEKAALALRIRESQKLKDYLEILRRVNWSDEYSEHPADTIGKYFENLRDFNLDGTITEAGKGMYRAQRFSHNMDDYNPVTRELAIIHGYSSLEEHREIWGRFDGTEETAPEWDKTFELPLVYQFVKWYNSAVKPITKEDLKAASKAIEDSYPNYCLSDEDIDVLLTFDDELAKEYFRNPAAFVFKGKVRSLSELIGRDKNGDWVPYVNNTEVRQYIGTDELKEYIETIRNFEYFDPEDRAEYVEALTELYNYTE